MVLLRPHSVVCSRSSCHYEPWAQNAMLGWQQSTSGRRRGATRDQAHTASPASNDRTSGLAVGQSSTAQRESREHEARGSTFYKPDPHVPHQEHRQGRRGAHRGGAVRRSVRGADLHVVVGGGPSQAHLRGVRHQFHEFARHLLP